MKSNSVKNAPKIYARNRILHGDCIEKMKRLPSKSVDLIVTDSPYLVNYQDRSGRSIANDKNSDWLQPAFSQMFRLLKNDSYCVSFYGWNAIDKFMHSWKQAGFRIVGQFVWHKNYASGTGHIQYRHECAYLSSFTTLYLFF